jgi:hypothetical protein
MDGLTKLFKPINALYNSKLAIKIMSIYVIVHSVLFIT